MVKNDKNPSKATPMIANHIHDALAQVRALKAQVLDSQRFTGYSGRTRLVSGGLAMAVGIVVTSPHFPVGNMPILLAWGTIFVLAATVNYGALFYWFLYDPKVKRDWRKLRPVLDHFPPFIVGAVLTAALVRHGHLDYLYGTWMCLHGLANLASRHVLPRAITWVGLFYIAAGAVCLLWPGLSFGNPWPMAAAFFVGELWSGAVLHFDHTRHFGAGKGGQHA